MRITGLEALTTSYCITSTTVDDMRGIDDLYTTATTVSTTLATATPPHHIQIDVATRYIDSLSVEQLAEMEEKLQIKEAQWEFPNSEGKVVVTIPMQEEYPKVLEKKNSKASI